MRAICLILAFLLTGPVLAEGRYETYSRDDGLTWWQQKLNEHPWLRQKLGQGFEFGRSMAVVVGIGSYRHFDDLSSTVGDAEKVAAFLIASGFDEVHTLTDDEATRENLDALISRAASTLGSSDRFLFYWAGHGGREDAGDGSLFGYLPFTNTGTDGSGDRVSMGEFRNWAQRIRAHHTLFVLDSCFSGNAMLAARSTADPTGERLSRPADHVMTSSASGQQSYGFSDGSGGLFTTAFLSALGANGRPSADTNFDGFVSLTEIELAVKRNLDPLAGQFGFIMSPQVASVGSSEGEFFFLSGLTPEGAEVQPGNPDVTAETRGETGTRTKPLPSVEPPFAWVLDRNMHLKLVGLASGKSHQSFPVGLDLRSGSFRMLAASRDGSYAVVSSAYPDRYPDRVARYDADGRMAWSIRSGRYGALDLSETGYVYAIKKTDDTRRATIQKIDAETGEVVKENTISTAGSDIVVDDSYESVWIAGYKGVARLDLELNILWQRTPQAGHAASIDVAPDGSLVLAARSTDNERPRLFNIGKDGTVITDVTLPSRPRHVSVSKNWDVWVLGDGALRFNPKDQNGWQSPARFDVGTATYGVPTSDGGILIAADGALTFFSRDGARRESLPGFNTEEASFALTD